MGIQAKALAVVTTKEYRLNKHYSLLMRDIKMESTAKFIFELITSIDEWVYLFSIYEPS